MKPVGLQKKHLTVLEGQKKVDAEDQIRTEKNQLKRPPDMVDRRCGKKRMAKDCKRVG